MTLSYGYPQDSNTMFMPKLISNNYTIAALKAWDVIDNVFNVKNNL